ncbi:winged helix-turn-helix domain-containing protein [uncultured Brevibacillus sp.]|nr:winged helix-turn-helix domain-containing protein [uncultured Brevibacillus sp.]
MFFCQNPNRVFTKEQIYDHVWKDEYGLCFGYKLVTAGKSS